MEDTSQRPTLDVAGTGAPLPAATSSSAGSPKHKVASPKQQQAAAAADNPESLPLAAGMPAPVPAAAAVAESETSGGGGGGSSDAAVSAAPMEATPTAAAAEEAPPKKSAAAAKKRKKMPMIGSRKKRKTATGGKAAGGKGKKKAAGDEEAAAAAGSEGAGDGTAAAGTDMSEKAESSVLKTASGAAAPMDTGAGGQARVENIGDVVGTTKEAAARAVSTEEVSDMPLVEGSGGDIPLKGSVEATPADAIVPQAGEHALGKKQLTEMTKQPLQAQTNEDAAMTDQPKGGEEKMSSISGIAAS